MNPSKLAIILAQLSPGERDHLASLAKTTTAYLYQIAGGHAQPSPKLAIRLEGAAQSLKLDLMRWDLRRDAELLWGAS